MIDGEQHVMTAGGGGWWHADVASANHATDYSFSVNGGSYRYPDPRSMWQPSGVHGPSRVLDHSRYTWHDTGWNAVALSDAIIYELHVGTFTEEGTFISAIQRLPYLKELGITHIELMPVNSFPGRHGWGYDGAALFAPQESYGGPEGLKRLVDACHAAGLAILLDVVYNHFGPVGNYSGVFGPYITEKHQTPWGGAINFDDAGSDEVRRFFCDNAIMWLRDYHIDGLRLDAIHAFVDSSEEHFLEQLSQEVEALSNELGRRLVLIAESDLNDPLVVTSRQNEQEKTRGYGMHAQWNDDFHHAIFAFLSGERQSYYRDFGSLTLIAKALQTAYVFDGQYSSYRGGIFGKPVEGLSADRFLGYIQNHDQIGNRAFGDRVHRVVGLRKARLAAALVLTAPFVPMIFQGEEFAASSPFLFFADHDDPDIARAVSEGRRREHSYGLESNLIPDPEAVETFLSSKLRWEETEVSPCREMLDWYRALIRLRTNQADLRNEKLDPASVQVDIAKSTLTTIRGNLILVFNFSDAEQHFPLAAPSRVLLTSETAVQLGSQHVMLPAESFAALQFI